MPTPDNCNHLTSYWKRRGNLVEKTCGHCAGVLAYDSVVTQPPVVTTGEQQDPRELQQEEQSYSL